LQGYSRESAVAEKCQIMVYFGEVNSRMKDFYDVWSLATHFDFDGAMLARAIRETFHWRRTAFSPMPVAFGASFAQDPEKQAQWAAFVRRHHLVKENIPTNLHETIQLVAAFLQPVLQTLAEDQPFEHRWSPGGPWALL